MNPMMKLMIISVASMVLSDLLGFYKARSVDKFATFDWVLFGVRVAIGALTGIVAALGGSSIPAQ